MYHFIFSSSGKKKLLLIMRSNSNLKAGQQKEDGDPNPKPQSSHPPSKHCPKILSRWRRAFIKLKVAGQLSAPDADAVTPSTAPDSSYHSLIKLITADLEYMHREANSLRDYNDQLGADLNALEAVFKDITKSNSKIEYLGVKEDLLNRLRKKLMKVKLAIPSKFGGDKNEHDKKLNIISICAEESKRIPQLHGTSVFKTSMEFKDFEARYQELERPVKLCLLCFSIFPQGATIKKRLMLQWWTVEGFASTTQVAQDYFNTLKEKGFIEAVNDNRSPSVGSCRIHPFHRAALVALAERAKMFNFESGGDPTQSFSGTFQACLMGAGLISYDDFKKKNDEGRGGDPVKLIKELIQELEKLHLLMNVDDHILEFVGDWFAKMKNLNILYLGRWKALATHHIEVEDPKFLEELGNMKFVKFLSLQGVSNIISLPRSILHLTNLDVLDLRACSNLESIPEKINLLRRLTHLDMSECYLLSHMPKGLSQLTNLKVLKGFFIAKDDPKSKSCTLEDLGKLKQLEKLCIYTDHDKFPQEKHVMHLEKLLALTKLTITWGVGKEDEKEGKGKPPLEIGEKEDEKEGKGKLPKNLKKLDLKCFPMEATPYWLKLENMEGVELKKLYIRGGKVRDLGQYQGIDGRAGDGKKWKVEELRLKYLGEIEMEWRQLQGLFPQLKYLEKVSCPNLTLFPCDAKGVWIKPE